MRFAIGYMSNITSNTPLDTYSDHMPSGSEFVGDVSFFLGSSTCSLSYFYFAIDFFNPIDRSSFVLPENSTSNDVMSALFISRIFAGSMFANNLRMRSLRCCLYPNVKNTVSTKQPQMPAMTARSEITRLRIAENPSETSLSMIVWHVLKYVVKLGKFCRMMLWIKSKGSVIMWE